MADEAFSNQRPVVIGAVIVAALTAAGLWYFFVFRPAQISQSVIETPTATPLASGAEESSLAALDEIPSGTAVPAPLSSPPAATGATQVAPTAPTGPAEVTILGSLLAMTAGLRGLGRLSRTRAPQTSIE